jgi:hypothetical protein
MIVIFKTNQILRVGKEGGVIEVIASEILVKNTKKISKIVLLFNKY